MSDLKEIAVADIRKGQELLVISGIVSEIFTTTHDGDTGGWDDGERFYLLANALPPFEAPWATVQRDADGNVWQFFEKESANGVAGESCGRLKDAESAQRFAPFTRLYTVQELIDIYEKLGDHDMVERLMSSVKDGDI